MRSLQYPGLINSGGSFVADVEEMTLLQNLICQYCKIYIMYKLLGALLEYENKLVCPTKLDQSSHIIKHLLILRKIHSSLMNGGGIV